RKVILGAAGQVIECRGLLRPYVEGSTDPDAALEGRDIILPALKVGQKLDAEKVEPKGHTTQPPARYTEASLVQALEGAGIGRPSTYANILSTIQDRGYVVKKGSALVPTWTGFATVQLLEQHFPNLVNYDFTARMEEDLDEIAGGRQGRVKYLTDFYSGADGLRSAIDSRLGEIDAIKISTIPTPRLGNSGIEVRVGRFGAYLKREESKANLPPDLLPDDLTLEKAEELLSNSGKNDTLGDDPETLLPVIAKAGRFGPYVQLGEETPPVRTASLFPSDKLEELTLERALELLKIPRMVGISEGEEVWAFNGRYGPYLKRGDETRNLGGHEALLTISLEETEVLFRQPAQRRGRGPSQSVVQTFEFEDRKPIELRAGRFGPYLTDGELNAYIRKDEDPAALKADEVRVMLLERGKPPKAKTSSAVGSAKKTGTKKPTSKSASSSKVSSSKARAKKPAAKPSSSVRKPVSSAARAKTVKAPPAEKSAKVDWGDLKVHLSVLTDLERKLITSIRDDGKKAEDVAPGLGLEVAKAKGMALQISKKLNQAYRAARG
ncbi:MAG: DNA topoisomerase I, partial [Pseudopedobacter sp.]|nr:DNA topoisomerase I [Deinococcales bacterium]